MAIITATAQDDLCRIELSGLSGTNTIYKFSSQNNFGSGEEIVLLTGTGDYFYDYLVEPGIIYAYSTDLTMSGGEAFLGSEGSFLYGKYNNLPAQVRFIYNSTVSGFSKVRKDSIVQTIGGVYPYVVRSAELGYKTFSFSGMIVSEMDNLLDFSSSYSKLISGIESSSINSLYENLYKTPYSPNQNQNFVLEKFFRKRILDWLTDGQPKIFKSDTEGIFFGKISEVSLERVENLNGLLYNVSFTFTETGPCNYSTASSIIVKNKVPAESFIHTSVAGLF